MESEFWDGDDVNDHGAGIDQVDPREAVQAALDRCFIALHRAKRNWIYASYRSEATRVVLFT